MTKNAAREKRTNLENPSEKGEMLRRTALSRESDKHDKGTLSDDMLVAEAHNHPRKQAERERPVRVPRGDTEREKEDEHTVRTGG